jgi:hypothetical protein
MAKRTAPKPRTPAGLAGPFVSNRTIDLAKFKPDISLQDLVEMFKPGNISIGPAFFQPIETLSPVKTVGLGRTNLTIKLSQVVQTDTLNMPTFASFDGPTVGVNRPAISMHFQPSAYGFTTVGTYFMAFSIAMSGQTTFNIGGNAGTGTITGLGTKTLSGQQIVTLIFKNLPPSHHAFGFLEQTGGGQWAWFQTKVSLPPIVIGL